MNFNLDTPLYKRKFRIITRFIKQKMGLEKSNYKPNFEMLKYMFKRTNDFEKNRMGDYNFTYDVYKYEFQFCRKIRYG